MRSRVRTIVVVSVAVALVALFLYNVDLWGVLAAIAAARPEWLALSLATMFLNLSIRALRWKYLLEPLAPTTFASAFRATAVGFAANAVLPARAGEVIRPYFLARQAPTDQQGRMTATGAFATIILERLLDVVTVLLMLASLVFVFGKDLAGVNPTGFAVVKWAGASAALVSTSALVVLFVLAGDPERLGRTMARLEQVLPSRLAGLLAAVAEKFARGLGAIRRPGRLLAALAWSLPLWLCIALGIWSMAMAFGFAIPFTGSFLMIALLTLGVAVPTPGAVGGFHEAFRVGATMFYGAPDAAAVGAAIVLHLFSIGPALLLGLFFAAQEGLNMGSMQRLASEAEPGRLV
ncbi:MAG TPA: lysylphosphatidylglycerol synthase transmembrane domain-containing protein [Vicinamibacterales bacterium]|nr:lysylphosphatidylglycerol synthase transmembrane domain-containing protein [Vicinamibacterales bacterium]